MSAAARKIGVIACCSGMLITSMYAIVPFLVLEAGVTQDRQAIGFWSGFVVAAFYMSRTVAAPFWGRLADRKRKAPVIQLSLVLTGCLIGLSGLTTSLQSLGALRVLTGACSTVHAICSAMAFDLAGKKGTAWVESGWSLSKLIGPGFSGSLLSFHLGNLTTHYPILMPCLSLAIIQFLMLLLVPSGSERTAPEALLASSGDATQANPSECVGRRSAGRALFLSAGVVFVNMCMEEVLVLYGIGELGIDAATIGNIYCIAGSIDLLLQNTILLRIIERADTISLRRCAMYFDVLILAIVPCFIHSANTMWLRLIGLGMFAGIRTASRYLFFVTNGVLLNEGSRGSLASINGWRVAISSAMQTVSPPIGASAYALFATSGYSHATFALAACFLACLALFA